jgi:hypothetical protein
LIRSLSVLWQDSADLLGRRTHSGLIMVSTKTFPQNRTYVTAVATALDAVLATDHASQSGEVIFLSHAQG